MSRYIYPAFLPSPSEMAAFDKATIESGVPSLNLMEQAGKAMAAVLKTRYFTGRKRINSLSIVCGPGNNGGDGLVVARYLKKNFKNINLIVSGASKYSADHIHNAERAGIKINLFGGEDYIKGIQARKIEKHDLAELLNDSDLIVDALLGTGQRRAPSGNLKILVELINAARSKGAKVAALDIPSGVDGGSGEVYTPHIKADLTITVECIKRGMLQYPGREACGDIEVISAGIDCSKGAEFSEIREEDLPDLTYRKTNSHKGSYGSLVVIGGSRNLPGAPLLSSMAGLRSGAGLVTTGHLTSAPAAYSWPEIMHVVVEDVYGFYREPHFESFRLALEGADALVLGPGLGHELETFDFIKKVLNFAVEHSLKTVIDADTMNFLARSPGDEFKGKLKNCVATPHPGEMSRVLAVSISDIQKDRYQSAKRLHEIFGCVSVLKGASTVIYGAGRGKVNLTGNPYMATPGSGDVLCGIIGAFLAHGLSPYEAAFSGVFVHGRSGDLALKGDAVPIIASDIVAAIPDALRSLK